MKFKYCLTRSSSPRDAVIAIYCSITPRGNIRVSFRKVLRQLLALSNTYVVYAADTRGNYREYKVLRAHWTEAEKMQAARDFINDCERIPVIGADPAFVQKRAAATPAPVTLATLPNKQPPPRRRLT